jgi:hypothetical protein
MKVMCGVAIHNRCKCKRGPLHLYLHVHGARMEVSEDVYEGYVCCGNSQSLHVQARSIEHIGVFLSPSCLLASAH